MGMLNMSEFSVFIQANVAVFFSFVPRHILFGHFQRGWRKQFIIYFVCCFGEILYHVCRSIRPHVRFTLRKLELLFGAIAGGKQVGISGYEASKVTDTFVFLIESLSPFAL